VVKVITVPWTFSHPAIVIPLRSMGGARLSLGALTVGSLSPDLGYYVGCFGLATQAHTIPGLITLCLPESLVVIAILRAMHHPIAHLLPGKLRQALHGVERMPSLMNLTVVCRLSICAIIGALTHVLWDSLTHESGYLVSQFPVLHAPVTVLAGRRFYVFDALQHVSTLLGATVIAVYMRRWLRTTHLAPASRDAGGDRWRFGLLAALAFLSLLAATPIAYTFATPHPGATNVFLFIVRLVIVATTFFTTLLSAAAIYIARDQRPASSCH
jgi:Domain of unknown function (DUF4184)